MTVEITLAVLVSLVSLGVTIFNSSRNRQRTNEKDIEERTTGLVRVEVKIDGLNQSMNELKDELRALRKDYQELTERVAKVESSARQAHKRLDDMNVGRHIGDD